MIARLCLIACLAGASACAQHHTGAAPVDGALVDGALVDGAADTSDAGADARAPDAGPTPRDSSVGDAVVDLPPVECGPNRCYHGEVCCSNICGWCATAGTCPTGGGLCS